MTNFSKALLNAANSLRKLIPSLSKKEVDVVGTCATAAVVARALIDKSGNLVIVADSLATLGASTVALTGAISVNDTTTPSVSLATGKTNTGFFLVFGKTSGSLKITTADSTAQAITISGAAQTSGASTWTIPDAAGVNQTFLSMVTSSGNIDFSASSGTFKTPTGLHTFGGKVAFKVIATAVAAAGSSTSDAAALGSATIVRISSDSAAKGVKLLAGVAGDIVEVHNTSATAAILYPATGGTINGLSANAGVLVPASKGTRAFCTAADTWTAFDMNAHATAA